MKPFFSSCIVLLSGCIAPASIAPPTPMEEVPVQKVLPNGNREYGFANGCKVILQPVQAVLVSETATCELYHRDIALLYASAD